MKNDVFTYSAKVWALGIVLMWGILFLIMLATTGGHIGFSIGMLELLLFMLIGSFMLSIPAWLAFMASVYLIVKLNIDYMFKKLLLFFTFPLLVFVLYMVMVNTKGKGTDEDINLFTITSVIAAALAVFIVKLPVETTANEG